MNQHSIKEVSATLKYGKLTPKFVGILSIVLVPITVLIFVGGIFLTIYERQAMYLIMSIIFGVLFGYCAVVVAQKYMLEYKELNKWIVDAVELEAYCKEDVSTRRSATTLGDVYVKFTYEDRELTIRSAPSSYTKGDPLKMYGNDKVFAWYINKKIEILYSPKYNEVMLLSPRNIETQFDNEIA